MRIATFNANGKMANQLEEIKSIILTLDIDILIIQETGKIKENCIARIRNFAINNDMVVELSTRSSGAKDGGVAVWVGPKWQHLKRNRIKFQPSTADKDRVLALELSNNTPGEHNKVGYYGYADPAANKPAVEEMHAFIKETLRGYRRRCPKGQFICAGDMNSAQYTVIDTDRTEQDTILTEDEAELENDHYVLDDLLSKGFGLHDTLRERYWNT